MSRSDDNLNRGLERLDPVLPGELEGARESEDAAELLESILAPGVVPVADDDALLPRPDRNLRRHAIPGLAAAALAAAVVVLLVGLPGGGGGGDGLSVALGRAAAAAASAPQPAGDLPYTYMKTRELAVDTAGADQRSWSVTRRATREEWLTWDGSGRLRVVSGPAGFVGPRDRAEWKAAGSPRFLTLGFEPRTEDRWVAAGLWNPRVEGFPTDPAALAGRLRVEARHDHGGLPVPAAILQSIAADLRDPGASPPVRQALYEAARRVPGIEYLGPRTDPEGRRGVAIGVTAPYAGRPALYSLIFDPRTSRVLATETTALGAAARAPRLLRASVYLGSRGSAPTATTPYLVYRIPAQNPRARALDAAFDDGRTGS
jgi:hypothetical protein